MSAKRERPPIHNATDMWREKYDIEHERAEALEARLYRVSAERDALRAYARAVTARCDEYIVRTSDLQAEHGVAAILADD